MLRESSETAARERVRLESGAGRSRAGAAVRRVPVALRYLGSEAAAKSGLRYQPVIWTAIALAAIAFYFPGRSDSGADAPALAAPVITVAPTTTVPASSPTTIAPPSASIPPTGVVRPSRPASPAFTPPTTTTTTAPAAPVPLAVRGFGWASSLSGTGLSTADVPEDTMPVANRLGSLDKASFIRLTGTATELVLIEDAEGAREAVGAGVVVACAITDPSWVEEPDQSLDDAPAWDAERCVAGTEDDGTWSFDLTSFADRTGQLGFALLPDASAPADFQVTFRAVS